jgi:hypothetical protein
MQQQWLWRLIQFAVLVLFLGCVTETERMPSHRYYDPQQDESVLDELKREFGWRKNTQGVTEAPYTRAARSVKETVGGWFSDEETAKGTPGWKRSLQQLKQAQTEAIRRSQEQQEQGQKQGVVEQRALGEAERVEEGTGYDNKE